MLRFLYALTALIAVTLLMPAVTHAADFDVKAATDAYLSTVSGEARAKSDAYFEGGYWLILWNALVAIGASLVILFTRMSTGMRNTAERITRMRWLQTFIYAALFTIVYSVLTFPMSIYEGFYREHAYGLSNMSLPDWLRDYGIGLAIGTIFGSIVIMLIYGVIRRSPRNWWLWASVVMAALLVVQFTVFPVLVAPLFNEYKPMREGELKAQILSMGRANGVPTDQVYEVNASRQTKRISANVSGFFGTTRISLNDNLLNRTTPAEVRAVMAHEIGHYVLNHGAELILSFSVLFAVGFAFTNFGFNLLHGAFGGLWGVRNIGDPAGLPIIFIAFTIFNVLATPVQNTIIRTNESEADIFGLNAAREPDGFAMAIVKLSEYRKLEPTPLEEFIFYDHPSGRTRVNMAMQWKAENLNEASAAPPAAAPTEAAPPSAGEPAPSAEPVPQGPEPDDTPVP